MDEEKGRSRRTQGYEIDSEAFKSFDGDDVAACLAIWREGCIKNDMIAEVINEGAHAYALEVEAEDQIHDMHQVIHTLIDSSIDRSQDISRMAQKKQKFAEPMFLTDIEAESDDISDLMHDMKTALKNLDAALELLSIMRERYKESFDSLIHEHHPEIPRAIEKAKLMNELK